MHSVQTPLACSGVCLVGVDEAANTILTSGDSHNDEILHSQRRQGEAVTILVVDGRDVPDQIASLGVESNDVGVKRGHEYLVAEDGESAVHAPATWPDVSRLLTLVEPDRASSASVESERPVILAGGIEDAIDHQRRDFEFAGCGCLTYPLRD